MTDAIHNLDDRTAQRLLATIVRSRVNVGSQTLEWTPDLRLAVVAEFDLSPSSVPVSEGELARQALLLLAEDPSTRSAIEVMASRSQQTLTKFDAGASIAIAVAVLFVLQTHVQFERDKQGKWKIWVEKKPTNESLLKGILQKLVAYLPK
jgi:hypothetical protein